MNSASSPGSQASLRATGTCTRPLRLLDIHALQHGTSSSSHGKTTELMLRKAHAAGHLRRRGWGIVAVLRLRTHAKPSSRYDVALTGVPGDMSLGWRSSCSGNAHLPTVLRVLAWIALGMILLLGLHAQDKNYQSKTHPGPFGPTGAGQRWERITYRVTSLIALGTLGITSDRLACKKPRERSRSATGAAPRMDPKSLIF